ncbi:serine/threonine-protein kinase OXI1 [Ziziphus jujuba]|uniref:non-specific serine/threonine protein kinase n=1 Tax=Ziziphus jujuba TaxID=326968 RepID=A0A6P4AC61_ZIZJJ|nr:serine/threonine-protein kinase OXI1 [Ziziphus jujuba]
MPAFSIKEEVCAKSETEYYLSQTHGSTSHLTAMDDDEDHHHRHDNNNNNSTCQIPSLDFQSLKVISALGRGAKGVVFLVKDEKRDETVALKVISKALIEKKAKAVDGQGNEYRRVCFEQQVLRRFQHPLFPKLRGVLNTEKLVGYAMDYCPGRDLSSLRKRQTEKMFSDDVIRFYAAELVLALEYLHKLGIVYRDLKPENIMIQQNGHIMIVDFDLSTKLSARLSPKKTQSDRVSKSVSLKKKKQRFPSFHCFCNSGISPDDSAAATAPEPPVDSVKTYSDSSEKSNSFVGTEEYVAPEIVSGDGHDFAVDWWSLGVVLYEMLYGHTPFRGSNRKETFYRILTKSPELTGETTPLRDLIRKLLEKDPTRRIEVDEIKGHDFFACVDWDSITQISRPPYIPDHANEWREEKEIDVESVIRGIFGGGENENNKGEKDDNNNNDNNNVVAKVWVEGLNPKPSEEDKFREF